MDPKTITYEVVGKDLKKIETVFSSITTQRDYNVILEEIKVEQELKNQDNAKHDERIAELQNDLQFAKDNNLDK